MSYVDNLLRLLQEEDDHNDDDKKPWGDAIAASLMIQIVTVTGLLLTVGMGYFGKLRGNESELLYTLSFKIIPSFACGALLATAVFLVIPESLTLLGGGHAAHGAEEEDAHDGHDHRFRSLQEEEHEEHNEAEAAWKFGAALLSGFIFPILLHVFFPTHDHALEEDKKEVVQQHEDVEEEAGSDKSPQTVETAEETAATKEINWTLACSILV